MKRTILVGLLGLAAGALLTTAFFRAWPAAVGGLAHDVAAAANNGRERAQNEALMRQVPEAGITPDMTPSEAEKRYKSALDLRLRKMEERIEAEQAQTGSSK